MSSQGHTYCLPEHFYIHGLPRKPPTCAIRGLANPAGIPQRFSLARSWSQKSRPWGLVEALGASNEPLFLGRHQRRHKRALWQGLSVGSDWEVTDEEDWESQEVAQKTLSPAYAITPRSEGAGGRERVSQCVSGSLSCEETDGNDTFLLCFLPCFSVLCILNNMSTGASHLELFLQGLLSAPDDSELEPSPDDPWETLERCCALGAGGQERQPRPLTHPGFSFSSTMSPGGRNWGLEGGLAEGKSFSRFPLPGQPCLFSPSFAPPAERTRSACQPGEEQKSPSPGWRPQAAGRSGG